MQLIERHIRVPGVGSYNIYPVGDLQKDSSGFDEELFSQLKNDVAKDPFPIVIGMGDYEDNFRRTVRTKIDVMTADDKEFRKVIDEEAYHRLDILTDYLMPVFKPKRGLCLGLLQGHHFYDFSDGTNSVNKMCGTFGCEYLYEMAMIRLIFHTGKERDCNAAWTIVIHVQHGTGGAGFSGPDMANLERKTVPYWDADLYLRGHSTKRWAAPFTEYKMTRKEPFRLIQRTKMAVNTGGFMRGYIDGESTYVSRKNMPPANLGYVVVTIQLGQMNKKTAVKKNLQKEYIKMSVTLK